VISRDGTDLCADCSRISRLCIGQLCCRVSAHKTHSFFSHFDQTNEEPFYGGHVGRKYRKREKWLHEQRERVLDRRWAKRQAERAKEKAAKEARKAARLRRAPPSTRKKKAPRKRPTPEEVAAAKRADLRKFTKDLGRATTQLDTDAKKLAARAKKRQARKQADKKQRKAERTRAFTKREADRAADRAATRAAQVVPLPQVPAPTAQEQQEQVVQQPFLADPKLEEAVCDAAPVDVSQAEQAGSCAETYTALNTPILFWLISVVAAALWGIVDSVVTPGATGDDVAAEEPEHGGPGAEIFVSPPAAAPEPSPGLARAEEASAAAVAAATVAPVPLKLEIRVGRSRHVLLFADPGAATVATLRDKMRDELHLALNACRLVPLQGAGADLRVHDNSASLLDVLGSCRQVEVMAKLQGGGGGVAGGTDPKPKAKKKVVVNTTISGLGLAAHLGPAVDDTARQDCVQAAAALAGALAATIGHNVAGVSYVNVVAVSALYEWAEEEAARDQYDAAVISGALGTIMSAQAFGSGLYLAAAGRSKGQGNEKLPESLREKVESVRKVFDRESQDAAEDLCRKLRLESSLALALKHALANKTFIGDVSSSVLSAAGQQFGISVRNHLRADSKKAVKRMLVEAVKLDLTLAGLEFNDKVQ
jgi:hypothetical protein